MDDQKAINVLLVVPFRADIEPYVPLGLGYLATALEKKGHVVKILDCIKDGIDFAQFEVYLRNDSPPDFVGFTVFTAALPSVKKHLEICKKIYPSTVTIIGGPHPSGAPKASLRYLSEADFGFVGEAEIGLPLLIERMINKHHIFDDIPGLIYRTNDNIFVNEPINLSEIDDFGFPNWKLIKPNEYPKEAVGIMTSRGCHCPCTFCATKLIHGKKLRMRTISTIIDEIILLQKEYGIKRLSIKDDNFTAKSSRVIDFCKKIIDRNIEMEFVCDNGIRLDSINETMLNFMKRAGFSWVGVGIESGSENILKKMKKRLSVKDIRRNVEMIQRCGLGVWGFFILGYPGETVSEIKKTIDLSLSLNLVNASFSTFLPLPGTDIYNDLYKEKKINENSDFLNFLPNAAYYSDTISRDQLLKLVAYAIFAFRCKKKLNYISTSPKCPTFFKEILGNEFLWRWTLDLLYNFPSIYQTNWVENYLKRIFITKVI